MQQSQRTDRALPPLATFLVLAGLIVGLYLVVGSHLDHGPAEASAAAPRVRAASPLETLTPAAQAAAPRLNRRDALARWRMLNSLRLRAYRERDISLFAAYLTPDSPLREPGRREIGRLLDDGVTMRPRSVTRRVEVRRMTGREIVVRQVSVQDPRFFRAGEDVTIDQPPKLVTIDWTMRPSAGAWKIFTSLVRRAEPLVDRGRR